MESGWFDMKSMSYYGIMEAVSVQVKCLSAVISDSNYKVSETS